MGSINAHTSGRLKPDGSYVHQALTISMAWLCLKLIFFEKEIEILISIGDGAYDATAWGCDLTYDYVKINGDYRT
mgnify:CR=1 FL=1